MRSNIKFIVSHDFLEKRLNKLEKFTTKQEIEGLLVEDDESIINILSKLSDIEPINEDEAKIFLLKLREISVDDKMESLLSCSHCGTVNQFQFDINEFINYDTFYFNDVLIPQGIFKAASDILSDKDLDKMTFKEYEKLDEIIKEQNESFLQNSSRTCRKCKKDIMIDIDIRTIFSKNNVSSLYKEYATLMTVSNNGKLDIDSMYPFERTLFLNLLTEKKE